MKCTAPNPLPAPTIMAVPIRMAVLEGCSRSSKPDKNLLAFVIPVSLGIEFATVIPADASLDKPEFP